MTPAGDHDGRARCLGRAGDPEADPGFAADHHHPLAGEIVGGRRSLSVFNRCGVHCLGLHRFFRVEIVLAAAVHLPLAGPSLNRSGAIRLNEVVAGRNIPISISFVKYRVS